jgi:predicted phosphodiesterase
MRIAVLSDIHGNLTAFEAVLEDLTKTSPDAVLFGGDLADSASAGAEIVDRIRGLGWAGVFGNTDEMLFRPESLENFVESSSAPASLWNAVREIAAYSRVQLGEERLRWMKALPRIYHLDPIELVHASPTDAWRAPSKSAEDQELQAIYGKSKMPYSVYGHIHQPYIRSLPNQRMVVNAGSVGLSADGDRRASYVILDEEGPTIRRLEYDVEREVSMIESSKAPHANWIAKMLRTGLPQLP